MALHKDFPASPHEVLEPAIRWFPADESLRDTGLESLLPPLVPKLRREIKTFRDGGYVGASETSISLLKWWFHTPHLVTNADGSTHEFKYYFAQQEAVETIIWLYDVAGVQDKYDLLRYDSQGRVSPNMFDEYWRRFVIKMATGSGKTKVMSLILAWSFFHKTYEENSDLARNFLVIAPNIIVLDRLYKDFNGLKIFFEDPVLPDNGFDGQNWRDDFQLTLHVQDNVNVIRPTGNIFLTNIHRVYASDDSVPSPDDLDLMDYYLGNRPVGKTTDSTVDLGDIVRDIEELVVINDEAHHIHDKSLAWFKSIEDIHNKLQQKGSYLSLQLDVTATPKHTNGAIFVQTVSDYPLVEAIHQNVVKHPVLPDQASRAKLQEKKSAKYTEKYADYIHLGVVEWRKSYEDHKKFGKKAVLFIMTDDTKNCDEVAEYLHTHYPEFERKDSVLVIHTKKNGEISEASTGKNKEELERLRREADRIDSEDSPYKAIVSVMVLKEGWDVRNVTTIVGLRPYSAQSKILPEQTLGRGLRRMYPHTDITEYVSVIGTDAFMDFVESIKSEGIELERKPMGDPTERGPNDPLIIEVDTENVNKDLDKLDIEIPKLTPRIYREYKNLNDLDVTSLGHTKVPYKQFTDKEKREIIFRDITTDEITHTTTLDTGTAADYRMVLGYFTQTIMREQRLISGYDVLYGKVKEFVANHLFEQPVDLEDANTLRNLSELQASKTLIETIKKAINELTVQDKGDAQIQGSVKLRNTRPFIANNQGYLVPKKSVFNKVIGDSNFELEFASFLEDCEDVVSFAKNYQAVHFNLDYVNADGNISHYYPDFFVKTANGTLYIAETKGREDLDVPLKMERLKQWCIDVQQVQPETKIDFVYVDQESFESYRPKSFSNLVAGFREYKD